MDSQPRPARRKWITHVAAGLIVASTGMQLVQPETPQTVPARKPPAWDNPQLDYRVAAVLKRACIDCHSNETRWPWYARMSPGSWLMTDHVRRGRAQLNLSHSWTIDDNEKGEIADAVAAGTMPPSSYLWLHSDARLSEADRNLIWDWATDRLRPPSIK